MSTWINLTALVKILAASLVAGAGLTLVFSIGLVGVSRQTARMSTGTELRPRRDGVSGLVLAGFCFAIVVAGSVVGIWAMTQK